MFFRNSHVYGAICCVLFFAASATGQPLADPLVEPVPNQQNTFRVRLNNPNLSTPYSRSFGPRATLIVNDFQCSGNNGSNGADGEIKSATATDENTCQVNGGNGGNGSHGSSVFLSAGKIVFQGWFHGRGGDGGRGGEAGCHGRYIGPGFTGKVVDQHGTAGSGGHGGNGATLIIHCREFSGSIAGNFSGGNGGNAGGSVSNHNVFNPQAVGWQGAPGGNGGTGGYVSYTGPVLPSNTNAGPLVYGHAMIPVRHQDVPLSGGAGGSGGQGGPWEDYVIPMKSEIECTTSLRGGMGGNGGHGGNTGMLSVTYRNSPVGLPQLCPSQIYYPAKGGTGGNSGPGGYWVTEFAHFRQGVAGFPGGPGQQGAVTNLPNPNSSSPIFTCPMSPTLPIFDNHFFVNNLGGQPGWIQYNCSSNTTLLPVAGYTFDLFDALQHAPNCSHFPSNGTYSDLPNGGGDGSSYAAATQVPLPYTGDYEPFHSGDPHGIWSPGHTSEEWKVYKFFKAFAPPNSTTYYGFADNDLGDPVAVKIDGTPGPGAIVDELWDDWGCITGAYENTTNQEQALWFTVVKSGRSYPLSMYIGPNPVSCPFY